MQLLWFRRDLRLLDNECVAAAANCGDQVVPFFVVDPWFYQNTQLTPVRINFLFQSLLDLDRNLRVRGSQLYLLEGNSVDIIQRLVDYFSQKDNELRLLFNRDVQVRYGINRDRQIKQFCKDQNVDLFIGTNHYIQQPKINWETWLKDHKSYLKGAIAPTPKRIKTAQLSWESSGLPIVDFPTLFNKYKRFWNLRRIDFRGGETAAHETLKSFADRRFWGYHWRLSQPWLAQKGSTSHLSPHLTFGTISTRIIYQEMQQRLRQLEDEDHPRAVKADFSIKSYCDRLRWHDSFTQRLYYRPDIGEKNYYREYDDWYSSEPLEGERAELFEAWKEGETGFPIIDASMRQLKTMGWMNFRTRAMCVTFLTINCGVSWHHGAEHFMDCLVDGDIAINHWQWQMQAGITNPFSNSFRIYNPSKNLVDRDPNLQFIRHWVPELRGYSLPEIEQKRYLDRSSYPDEIIDWKQTRKVNGKVISELRAIVRQRLKAEQGEEFEAAQKVKGVIERYMKFKQQEYERSRHQQLELF
ncbi:MAG: FAD-binding domain-containing protein [Cyanobacteria bacterium P01_C01_bin.89]